MIEIFDDRIEISNPGRLLHSKKVDRLIGTNPESRNELLASSFRRYHICEERGTGFVKSVADIELFGLPPLKFEEGENHFKVTIFSPRTFANMTVQERIEACYQHATICFLSHKYMTNTSLRGRLKMPKKQSPMVSKVIRETLEAGRIKPKDPNNTSRKYNEYIPFWA